MDNAQKAIMIGVGLFITIIVIAAVMLITGMGQDLLNSGTEQLGNISNQLESQLTQEFDGKTMMGAQVLAAVKKYYNQSNMIIEVFNTTARIELGGSMEAGMETNDSSSFQPYKGTRVKYSRIKENSPKYTISDLSDITNKDTYIITNSKYTSYLIEVNDAVVGIRFVKSGIKN